MATGSLGLETDSTLDPVPKREQDDFEINE